MSKRPAIEIALDLREMPSLAKTVRKRPLPPEVMPLLRVAAGSSQHTQEFAGKYRRSEAHIREACIFFLQQAMLFSGADNYRTLGLAPGAPAEQVREHRRWLLMWLHPDRNMDKWESALFDKVVAAANAINGGSPTSATVKQVGRRRHRGMRAPRAPKRSQANAQSVMKRPQAASWPSMQVKPLILLLLAATAFLLSVATVISVLAAEAGHGVRIDPMTAISGAF
ncbi:J domain-containing protein [Taklimakanibacter deserti]|uniref:J domain-containing protein n=1 Tax=Taklimakanibacter deserti TaxID=2267839 RepID=UPI000E652B69